MPQELWRLYRKAMHTVVNGLSQTSAGLVDTDRTVADRLVGLCREAAAEGVVLLRNATGCCRWRPALRLRCSGACSATGSPSATARAET